MFKSLLNKAKMEIIPVKTIAEKAESWGGNGIIFHIKNGKGLLKHGYGALKDEEVENCFVEYIINSEIER